MGTPKKWGPNSATQEEEEAVLIVGDDDFFLRSGGAGERVTAPRPHNGAHYLGLHYSSVGKWHFSERQI